MKPLSFWAKSHPVYTRIIIFISHVLLIWIAVKLADLLTGITGQISSLWLYIFILAFFIAGMFYPRSRFKKNDYAKRKGYDLLIAELGFFTSFECV